MSEPAGNIRVVLVGTTHAGNIGAAARAMKVMGLRRLFLVAPAKFPAAEATAMATGADDLLAEAVVVDDLVEAIAGCALVFGTTARTRSLPQLLLDARTAAVRAVAEAGDREVALVFGREKSGLSNDEVRHCHGLISIPTSAAYTSLNLAQAVQVLAYEIHLAGLDAVPGERPPSDWQPVGPERMEVYFQRLEACLLAIGFIDPKHPKRLMQRLRRLYLRARPDENEYNILNGIVTRTIGLARERSDQARD